MNVAPIESAGAASVAAAGGVAKPGGDKAFEALVEHLVASQSQAEAAAGQQMQALATGQAESLHAVSLAVAQADLSFRLVLELRNRMTEAYQEVMRMQV